MRPSNTLQQQADEYKALYARVAAENRWLRQQARESVAVVCALVDELLEAWRELAGQPLAAPGVTRHGDVPYVDLPADFSMIVQTENGPRTIVNDGGELRTDLPICQWMR
jgi:hypothetical protein